MTKKINLENILITAATLLAIFLRLKDLGKMNLHADEAYYWDWSRHLSFGYFPHPPMVAWVIEIGRKIFSDSEAGIRSLFVVSGIITIFLIYLLTKILFDKKTAIVAFLISATSPAYVFASRLATPDSLIIFLWALSMIYFWLAIKKNNMLYFYLFGIALGLGLLSKYQMFFFTPSLFLYLIMSKKRVYYLKTPGIYLAFSIALVIFMPNLIWNATHNWVTFIFQYKHGTALSFPDGININATYMNIRRFILETLFFQDPVIKFTTILPLLVFIVYGIKKESEPVKYCFLIFAPITLYFSVYIGHTHWFFPAAISLYILTGLVLTKAIGHKIALYSLTTLIMLVNTYSSLKLIDTFTNGKTLPKYFDTDAFRQVFYDSSQMNFTVQKIATETKYSKNENIIAENYLITSELAYYLPNHPATYSPNGQYLVWGPPKQLTKTIVIGYRPSFFKDTNIKTIKTPNYNFYYEIADNQIPKITKDWSMHYEGP